MADQLVKQRGKCRVLVTDGVIISRIPEGTCSSPLARWAYNMGAPVALCRAAHVAWRWIIP
jgi:hypothetical protein